MKVFISQPMMNKPNDILQKERQELKLKLEADGHEVLDSVFDLGPDATPLDYLIKSLEILKEADLVVFMKDWDISRGCVIEYEVAMRYGKYVRII